MLLVVTLRYGTTIVRHLPVYPRSFPGCHFEVCSGAMDLRFPSCLSEDVDSVSLIGTGESERIEVDETTDG
jgi:hypothetical protein